MFGGCKIWDVRDFWTCELVVVQNFLRAKVLACAKFWTCSFAHYTGNPTLCPNGHFSQAISQQRITMNGDM